MQECNPTAAPVQPPEKAAFKALKHGLKGPAVRLDGLYLHVPFCFHKCHYCDFYSLVETEGKSRQGAFTDALIAELDAWVGCVERLEPETVFVGGGTPTLLRADLWGRLLEALKARGVLGRVSEFTVEANPETVTSELMAALADGGVDRVSMGAQSFDPGQLKTLERWHDPETVGKAVAITRGAGIKNINLDLIFAIPGQTLEALDRDLDKALTLEPTHLSCYSLIFEPNTPLTQKLKLGRISAVGEELERAMYERVIERLDAAGFEHYEVSNWARRGSGIGYRVSEASDDENTDTRCQHNLMYWRNLNWLGLGPGAASHVDGARWKNEPHLGRYIAGSPTPPTVDHEQLPARQRLGEQIMLGLRLRCGLERVWVDEHIPAADARRETINELIGLGMLEETETHLRLTHRGLFLADSVIAKLL